MNVTYNSCTNIMIEMTMEYRKLHQYLASIGGEMTFQKKENLEIKQKFNFNYDLQKKFDEKNTDNEKLRKLNEDLNSKLEKLELKNKKYKNNLGIMQSEINNIKEKSDK